MRHHETLHASHVSPPGSPSSASPRHRRALFGALFGALILCAYWAEAAPFQWRLDPTTGNATAQLTTWDSASTALTQDNYVLYYHQPNQTHDGQFLVYQHLKCSCGSQGCGQSPASLEYRRLDLETGSETLLKGAGLANGAVVHGHHLFVGARDTPSGHYLRLERIDIRDGTTACLTPLPTGQNLTGSMSVNADGTALIYQTLPAAVRGGGGITRVHFLSPSPPTLCPSFNTDTVLDPYDPNIEHLQFSSADPEVFTFVDRAGDRLSELGIGTVTPTGSTWNRLSSSQAYLDSFQRFPHPFWDANGLLWSDAINPSSTVTPPLSEAFVRFELDTATGLVQHHAAVEMTDLDWHHHQAGGRSQGWFVGDGLNTVSRQGFGEPYISLFHLQPPTAPQTLGGALERFRLSDSLGNENAGRGNRGANAHLLETLDGVVFSVPYDFNTGESADVLGCPASRNVFLAKIPTHLRARMRDDVVLTRGADGPFKHANRLSVDPLGQSWSIDYGSGGSTPSLGDGIIDRIAGPISSGSHHVGLADLNGDGVDDRLVFSELSSGGWSIEAAYTPYDGVLPTAQVTSDTFQSYPGPSFPPPVFGDLNGDGKDDLILLDGGGPTVLWKGRFSADTALPAFPYAPLGLPWEAASPFGDPSVDEHFFAADVDGDGYADRVVVRPFGGHWRWSLDLGTPSGFGDGVEDASFVGAGYTTDTPLMADVNLDGRADIVIAREQNGQLRWYVNPSSAGSFGTAWDPPSGRGFFGAVGQPLIGTFGRYHTVQP